MSGRVVLLDVLGTLVRDPFPEDVPAFFGVTLEELYALKHPTAWQRFERGELGEADLALGYFRDGRPCDVEGFKATLRAGYRYLDGIEPLLADLRAAGVEAHALSNYPPWWRLIEEALGLSRYLRWSFVSCEMGVRKPDPGAYRTPLERLGVEPAACLFVDDREENCAGARALGLEALRFEGASALRGELEKRGILTPP